MQVVHLVVSETPIVAIHRVKQLAQYNASTIDASNHRNAAQIAIVGRTTFVSRIFVKLDVVIVEIVQEEKPAKRRLVRRLACANKLSHQELTSK